MKTQAGTPPEQVETLRTKIKLLFDPTGELGAEDSTRLLRTLSRVHLDSIQQQGDRYWCPWVVVQQQDDGGVSVQQRFVHAAEAALHLKHQIEQLKATLRGKPDQFKAEAGRLRAVHDPEGNLGASGTYCPVKRLSDAVAEQMEGVQYQIKRGAVIISIPSLDDDTSRQVQDTLAADLIAKKKQAQQAADQVAAAS